MAEQQLATVQVNVQLLAFGQAHVRIAETPVRPEEPEAAKAKQILRELPHSTGTSNNWLSYRGAGGISL